MRILHFVLLALFYCIAPAGVLWLCRRYRWAGKIGVILMLYFIGAILANIGLLPGGEHPDAASLQSMQNLFTNAMIPLAIPLMLFSCPFILDVIEASGALANMSVSPLRGLDRAASDTVNVAGMRRSSVTSTLFLENKAPVVKLYFRSTSQNG